MKIRSIASVHGAPICGGIAAWLLIVPALSAGTIYVDGDATGANNGSSWANAYTSLQTALSVAVAGDEVWVAEGIYKPGTSRIDAFQLRDGVSLYGGFAGTETLRSERDWVNHVTILSGDVGEAGNPTDNAYHVLKGANGAILDGFTITGGRGGTNWPHVSGAGMFNSNASPVVVNCRFTDNAAYFAAGSGGAIFNLHSSPTISNCTFDGNSAYWGGAICNLNGGTVAVVNCEFTDNTADIGGAVNNENAAAIFRDCRFMRNTGEGGGMHNRGCAPFLINCVFAQNNAGLWDGGGMRNIAASPAVQNALFVENYTKEGNGAGAHSFKGAPQYVNCTFYGNRAELGAGGAIFNDSAAGAAFKNGILWSNTAGMAGAEVFNTGGTFAVSFTDIEGGLNGGKCGGEPSTDSGGNLAAWPLFVDVGDFDGPDGRFATADDGLQLNALLSGVSPCIDAATAGGAPGYDLANLARPKQYGFDMGAYEYNPDYDGDGLDNLLEYRIGSNAMSTDSDGDGVADGVEYYTYGTSPILADTDGDGMPDGWEIAYNLDPFVNDADQDRDLDWVSNLQEYQNSLNPLLADSNSDRTNDYAAVFGKSGARYTYDRIDRLTGVEYERGFSIAYLYDDNGNLLRQFYLERDEDGDGLPDLWEFQNGLSWTNGEDGQGLTGDADGDGWSNLQEWQGRGNPTNAASRPDIFGVAPGTAAVFNVGFVATRFTMAAGQLDDGGDEIAIGADGNPGNVTNALLILSPTFDGWTTQRVTVGTVGITSIAIGQPTNTATPSLYVGTRQTEGSGSVLRVSRTVNGWTNELLAFSTTEAAFVLGVRPGRDVLISLGRTNEVPYALTSLACSNGTWVVTTIDTNSSERGLGTLGFATSNDAVGGGLRLLNAGGIQLVGSNGTPILIPEPPATNRLLWSGRSLASGAIRGGDSSSILYQYIEDMNSNGVADGNDSIVLFEAELIATNGIQRTLRKTALTGSGLARTYSLACVNLTNGAGRILFTAEPDGGIYSWTPPTSTGALVRKAFALHRVGSAWHDLSAFRPMTPGEGMAGLNVDTTTPTTCRVLTWQPDNQLWTPAAIPQTAPVTRILPDPNSGAGLSLVKVKIWDAEGNRSVPMLQYLDPASSNWQDATVLTLDGIAYSYALAVEAAPTGSIHSLVWNSGSDLGVTFTNNILLRARSVDITLWGDWSEPVLYRIEGSTDSDKDGMPDTWELSRNLNPLDATGDSGAGADPDGDGMKNIDEYTADTDPLDGDSLLTITGVRTDPAGLRIDWKGGSMAWQYIQTRVTLVGTGETWSSIHTVSPPTPTSNYVIDAGATNSSLFFRIKAER